MICPKCGKETPSILRICENCNEDLELYRSARNKSISGTENEEGITGAILSLGSFGGILLMVIAVVWFVLGLKANRIFFYPPVLFVIGIGGFFKGFSK